MGMFKGYWLWLSRIPFVAFIISFILCFVGVIEMTGGCLFLNLCTIVLRFSGRIFITHCGKVCISLTNTTFSLQQLRSFDADIARILHGSLYSLHFMALLRATSLGLFVCERRSSAKRRAGIANDPENSVGTQPEFVSTLLDGIEFSLYLPTIFYGPLNTFEDWHNFIYKVSILNKTRRFTVTQYSFVFMQNLDQEAKSSLNYLKTGR